MYTLSCDNPDCGDEIERGAGAPGMVARERVFCDACGNVAAQVDAILQREAILATHETVARLGERRTALMKQLLPVGKGGTGEGIGFRDPLPIVGAPDA